MHSTVSIDRIKPCVIKKQQITSTDKINSNVDSEDNIDDSADQKDNLTEVSANKSKPDLETHDSTRGLDDHVSRAGRRIKFNRKNYYYYY